MFDICSQSYSDFSWKILEREYKLREKFYCLILLFAILGCTDSNNHELKFGNSLILFGNNWLSSKGEIMVFDLENFKEYTIPNPDYNSDYKFFNGKNLLISRLGGKYGNYDLYNLEDLNLKSYQILSDKEDWKNIITNYRDSLIIYSNYNEVFFEKLKGANRDSINVNADLILQILSNSFGIIAISYTTKEGITFPYEPKELLLVELKTKKRYKPPVYPSYISDWTPDGKNLLYLDSTFKILTFPELQTQEFYQLNIDSLNIQTDAKFINDSLLVFIGSDTSSKSGDNQLYLFDYIEKKIIRQLTTGPGAKVIFDVFNKK